MSKKRQDSNKLLKQIIETGMGDVDKLSEQDLDRLMKHHHDEIKDTYDLYDVWIEDLKFEEDCTKEDAKAKRTNK